MTISNQIKTTFLLILIFKATISHDFLPTLNCLSRESNKQRAHQSQACCNLSEASICTSYISWRNLCMDHITIGKRRKKKEERKEDDVEIQQKNSTQIIFQIPLSHKELPQLGQYPFQSLQITSPEAWPKGFLLSHCKNILGIIYVKAELY